jgi:hypothetical protein
MTAESSGGEGNLLAYDDKEELVMCSTARAIRTGPARVGLNWTEANWPLSWRVAQGWDVDFSLDERFPTKHAPTLGSPSANAFIRFVLPFLAACGRPMPSKAGRLTWKGCEFAARRPPNFQGCE